MLVIDDSFIKQVLNHGNSIILIILIASVCCCGIILVMASLQLPYLFRMFTAQKQMVEFIYCTDRAVVGMITRNCREY